MSFTFDHITMLHLILLKHDELIHTQYTCTIESRCASVFSSFKRKKTFETTCYSMHFLSSSSAASITSIWWPWFFVRYKCIIYECIIYESRSKSTRLCVWILRFVVLFESVGCTAFSFFIESELEKEKHASFVVITQQHTHTCTDQSSSIKIIARMVRDGFEWCCMS